MARACLRIHALYLQGCLNQPIYQLHVDCGKWWIYLRTRSGETMAQIIFHILNNRFYQVRAAAVGFYLLGKLQVEGVMRDL